MLFYCNIFTFNHVISFREVVFNRVSSFFNPWTYFNNLLINIFFVSFSIFSTFFSLFGIVFGTVVPLSTIRRVGQGSFSVISQPSWSSTGSITLYAEQFFSYRQNNIIFILHWRTYYSWAIIHFSHLGGKSVY